MKCKHCSADLEYEGGALVDMRSGDFGGTYDYCPANPVGTEDERLHEPDPTWAGLWGADPNWKAPDE